MSLIRDVREEGLFEDHFPHDYFFLVLVRVFVFEVLDVFLEIRSHCFFPPIGIRIKLLYNTTTLPPPPTTHRSPITRERVVDRYITILFLLLPYNYPPVGWGRGAEGFIKLNEFRLDYQLISFNSWRLIEDMVKEKTSKKDTMIGQYVIVRADRAGVFAGTLLEKEGNEVVMRDARRLWYWKGASSLSQMAITGPMSPNECKFPAPVERILVLGVIEIIPCTKQARSVIEGVKVWKQD